MKNGNEYENKEAAECFNTLAKKLSNSWNVDDGTTHKDTKFDFKLKSEHDVSVIVKGIKISKSCTLHGLSRRLVKDAFKVIIPALTYLYNKCLALGDIPESWCVGTISPIPKTTVTSTDAQN